MAGVALKSLALNHFRSYKRGIFNFSPNGSILFGQNGSGKTNMLEAMSLFSPGKGLRKSKNCEISRKPEELGWKIIGIFESVEGLFEIEVFFQPKGEKTILLDGKRIAQSKMNELVKVLWITPQMDRLWTSGASDRRNFIDRISFGFFSNHAKLLSSYEKLIRERNELFRIGSFEKSWMDALEIQIAKFGMEISLNRNKTIKLLNDSTNSQSGFPIPKLELLGDDFIDKNFYLRKLHNSRKIDSLSCRTSVGPHKSDLKMTYVDKAIDARHCSTGEQKALLISIILSISREIIKDSGKAPILLLDEVGAHLDDQRRRDLINELYKQNVQFFITATELSFFEVGNDEIEYLKLENDEGKSFMN